MDDLTTPNQPNSVTPSNLPAEPAVPPVTIPQPTPPGIAPSAPPTPEPEKPLVSTPPSKPPPEEPSLVAPTSPRKSRAKIILASIVGLFVLASIPAAVYLVQQRQEMRKEAVVSGHTQTVCGIRLGPPFNEQPPSAANDGTYSITVPIKNLQWSPFGGSTTVELETYSCVCNEGGGSPPGICVPCEEKVIEITLGSGETHDLVLPARQSSGAVCGSFQVDLAVLSVNRDYNCEIPADLGLAAWGLWLTQIDLKDCVTSCLDLTSEPEASTLETGNEVKFTCKGSSWADKPINHVEFRAQIDGGSWANLGTSSVVATTSEGISSGTKNYIIPQTGNYRIECRACTSTDETVCTGWGSAGVSSP